MDDYITVTESVSLHPPQMLVICSRCKRPRGMHIGVVFDSTGYPGQERIDILVCTELLPLFIPSEPPLQERFDKFLAANKPETIFVNQYGRRSKILYADSSYQYRSIEDGPWCRVLVYWEDAEPSEISAIWYSLGEPEVAADGA